jgi:subtilisin
VTFERVAIRPLTVLFSTVLCLILVSALFPVAAVAAPEGKVREYIVTLAVADTGQVIQPSSRTARQRIARRADRVKGATVRLTREHGLKARHRFDRAATGFSARMTASQAAEVAGDSSVAGVRLARKFKLSGEIVPRGVKRVLAAPSGTAAPDVNAHVAVMDTGIGPVGSDGSPAAMGPSGKPELNIAGGINCAAPGAAGFDPSHWGDTHGHGTHVSGIIGARDNNVGVVGVAPGARLWAVRVFGGSTGSEAAILCGLDWIIATHSNSTPDIDVINMSF